MSIYKHIYICLYILAYIYIYVIKGGLKPHSGSAIQFKNWIKKIIHDWDFENICTAHYGVLVGDGTFVHIDLCIHIISMIWSILLVCKSMIYTC